MDEEELEGRSGWGGNAAASPSVPRWVRRDATLIAPACQTEEFEEGILAQTKTRTLPTTSRERKHVHAGFATRTRNVYTDTE